MDIRKGRLLLAIICLSLVMPMVIAPTVVAWSGLLHEHYNTGDSSAVGFYGNAWRAQTFTVAEAHSVTSVRLMLFRYDNPGDVIVSIKNTDGSGHPTGDDLCSVTVNGNEFATSSDIGWETMTFVTSYALDEGSKYAVVVRAPDGDDDNKLGWRADGTSPTYENGNYEHSSDAGTNWNDYGSKDLMFEEYGTATGSGDISLVYMAAAAFLIFIAVEATI